MHKKVDTGPLFPSARKRALRPYKDLGTRLRLTMELYEERKARLEKIIATTQLRLASKKWIVFDLDLIWIEIRVLIPRNELARPVMGTIFLV